MGILILLIGILLVGIFSIISLLFNYHLFNSLDKTSELYFVIKNIIYVQPILIFLVLVIYFLLTPIESFTNGGKFNHNYDEPKVLGSKKFRKIVRIFIFINFYSFRDKYFSSGDFTNNAAEPMSYFIVILFGLIIILISRLIEKSTKTFVIEKTNEEKSEN